MATSFSAASPFLVVNGVPQADDVPPVSNLLESLAGVYTTTRTHGNASLLLFWERHLRRLSNSARIIANHRPDFFGAPAPVDLSAMRPLVDESLQVGLGFALAERVRRAEVVEEFTELAVTVLICNGGVSGSCALDLYLHIGFYVPPVFGAAGARLALAGRGRDVAEAKYSQWARIRKDLERMRPPMVSELLLSNDGDRILEGSVTNFFVVCKVGLGFALAKRVRRAEVVEEFTELAVTVLICNGGVSGSSALDLYLHIGFYVPPILGAAGARLALAGRGRDVAEAKIRKHLERMRPPMVSELLLSNDGDRILEGSVTNFFVVCKVSFERYFDLILN
ncbi:hypothetical protein IEQ34_015440 [Dendrobium chrysotoxum]|uniref:Uncharacterized protein n=1 Tax=Dendrobium chrysotoxum TaxID=161865 RepID=A0AAV7GID8_DENCH|nr:hypothetical protein IEQ34_015440 [Dendrobium chrysotoxum]